jgi:hypothetical protein
MKRVELRGLQIILAILIVGCVWIMANGEALGYHHLILCSCVLSFTASCLIKPDKD